MEDYDVESIMQEIERELIKSMKRTLSGHKKNEKAEDFNWEQWQAKKLRSLVRFKKENRAIFKKYKQKIDFITRVQLMKQYLEGGKNVDTQIKNAVAKGYLVKKNAGDSFFNAQNKKLLALIKAIDSDMDKAQTAALRMMDDVYRTTLYKSQMFLSSGAKTVEQAVDMAQKEFLSKGITCITYKDGREVGISSWAKMAIRTSNKRAYLMGEGERRKEWGESLVLVSQYLQCSPLCIDWQGRVYIDDVYSGGKKGDAKYPLLSSAIGSSGSQLFHPNCKHTASTFFEGISNKPKILDRETTEEQYEKAVRKAEIERNIQKYKRLKEGSHDPENIKKYNSKIKEWETRSNNGE